MMDLSSLGKIHWTSYNGITYGVREGSMPRREGELMSASMHSTAAGWGESVSPAEVTPRDKELGIISTEVIVETITVVEGRRKEG